MGNDTFAAYLLGNSLEHVIPKARFDFYIDSPWGADSKDSLGGFYEATSLTSKKRQLSYADRRVRYRNVMRELGSAMGSDVGYISAAGLAALVLDPGLESKDDEDASVVSFQAELMRVQARARLLLNR